MPRPGLRSQNKAEVRVEAFDPKRVKIEVVLMTQKLHMDSSWKI